jgi:hypothetical protein
MYTIQSCEETPRHGSHNGSQIGIAMREHTHLDTIQRLAEQLRCIERGQPTRASSKLISTGLFVLDDLLPDRGIQPGSIIEWLSPGPGSGAGSLAFLIAAHQMRAERTLIVIDPQHRFYPPAAANLGIDLERTIVVRPSDTKDTLWALEQTLRCAGVAVAVCYLDHLDDRIFRRLQLAAEAGGGIGLFLRADRFIEQPSWAEVRVRVRGQRAEGKRQRAEGKRQKAEGRKQQAEGRSQNVSPPLAFSLQPFAFPERFLQLELLRCRNNSDNKNVLIGIDDETGSVRLVSELASATRLPRAARA